MTPRCARHSRIRARRSRRSEFTEDGRDFAVAVNARVLTNDPRVNLELAVSGAGLTMGLQNWVRPYIERGELIPALEAYSTPFTGFYLYYPSGKRTSPALRALTNYLLDLRHRGPTPG